MAKLKAKKTLPSRLTLGVIKLVIVLSPSLHLLIVVQKRLRVSADVLRPVFVPKCEVISEPVLIKLLCIVLQAGRRRKLRFLLPRTGLWYTVLTVGLDFAQRTPDCLYTNKDLGKFKLVDRSTRHPLLSVIIPNWNGVHYLPACLGSLRCQTYPNLEVILVDNASSDASVAFVKRDYPEVVLVQLEKNLGLTGGINRGVQVARGEIIASLNNDTEVVSNWAEALVTTLLGHPDAGMAASKMLLFDRRDTLH
jgi:hypothetical protein